MAKLLKERDVTELLTMADAIDVVENAFRSQAKGHAVNVVRQRGTLGSASVHILSAISSSTDTIGVKAYPIVRTDITVGASFTMLVYRASTGVLLGVLEASGLGQIRTGAASGVATKYLARPESRFAVIFGAGFQAKSQLEALGCVLPRLERVVVVGRSPDRVKTFCSEMAHLPFEVAPAADARRAVTEADVVVTATGARTPLFDGAWLKPGAHINAAGSNYRDKREIDATAVRRSDHIIVDDVAVARLECGDLLAPDVELDWRRIISLAQAVEEPTIRQSDDDITLFESQGIGLEDLAVAAHVLELAERRGLGMEIPLN